MPPSCPPAPRSSRESGWRSRNELKTGRRKRERRYTTQRNPSDKSDKVISHHYYANDALNDQSKKLVVFNIQVT
ncbi:hypothetical protein DPMN_068871 [Dreissena polymorpha]|uniref:Uncharacterized protein n=1 Tax=Dreissena polymorpha TaxID=45954 RepID=A0A9D3YYD4_DREPO|nr:hypothetical protein DPMN_068871 [Dreissena polymorpha]